MDSVEDIFNKINFLKGKQATILIAIDGFGGSGKSSLARSIQQKFPDTVIVEMDDFYSPELKRPDYRRIYKEVIKPIKEGKTAIFKIYDWKADKLVDGKPVSPENIILIEGVFSMHKELLNSYDVKIWVDSSQEIGFKRGLNRDKNQYGIDTSEKWVKHWMPREKEYVNSQNPHQKADFVINGTK
ncbi:MAG: uridine kinase [Candidatus Daviesbacteria bacterium]|nr:uridine kinase [Candidatus Daviesbacteria bacterium]